MEDEAKGCDALQRYRETPDSPLQMVDVVSPPLTVREHLHRSTIPPDAELDKIDGAKRIARGQTEGK